MLPWQVRTPRGPWNTFGNSELEDWRLFARVSKPLADGDPSSLPPRGQYRGRGRGRGSLVQRARARPRRCLSMPSSRTLRWCLRRGDSRLGCLRVRRPHFSAGGHRAHRVAATRYSLFCCASGLWLVATVRARKSVMSPRSFRSGREGILTASRSLLREPRRRCRLPRKTP